MHQRYLCITPIGRGDGDGIGPYLPSTGAVRITWYRESHR